MKSAKFISFTLFFLILLFGISASTSRAQNSEDLSNTLRKYQNSGWRITKTMVPFEGFSEGFEAKLCEQGSACLSGYHLEKIDSRGCTDEAVIRVECTFGNTMIGKIPNLCVPITGSSLSVQEVITPPNVTCINDNAASSNACTLTANEDVERKELFKQIEDKYKFRVEDSNACGEALGCGTNPPWTSNELNTIKDTLDSLPGCFINGINLTTITGVTKGGGQGVDALGQQISRNVCCSEAGRKACIYATTFGLGYNGITFCGDSYKNPPGSCKESFDLKGILVHELTHAYQNQGVLFPPMVYDRPLIKDWLTSTGWSVRGPVCVPVFGCNVLKRIPDDLPTVYAKKEQSPLEDMAESVRLYYEDPEALKAVSPRRYDFVKSKIMCGVEF